MFTEQRAFLGNQTQNHLEGAVMTNPSPGQVPPQWVRKHGSFAGTAIANGRWERNPGKNNGMNAHITLEGHGDPSFMGSAIMATVVALGLTVLSPDEKTGGYLTPVLALGL